MTIDRNIELADVGASDKAAVCLLLDKQAHTLFQIDSEPTGQGDVRRLGQGLEVDVVANFVQTNQSSGYFIDVVARIEMRRDIIKRNTQMRTAAVVGKVEGEVVHPHVSGSIPSGIFNQAR